MLRASRTKRCILKIFQEEKETAARGTGGLSDEEREFSQRSKVARQREVSHANLSAASSSLVRYLVYIESRELCADPFLSDRFTMSIANEYHSSRFNAVSNVGFLPAVADEY